MVSPRAISHAAASAASARAVISRENFSASVTPRSIRQVMPSSSDCLSRRRRSIRSVSASRGPRLGARARLKSTRRRGAAKVAGSARAFRSSGCVTRSWVSSSPRAQSLTRLARSCGRSARSSRYAVRGPAAATKRSNWLSASSGSGLCHKASRSTGKMARIARRSGRAYGTSGRPSRTRRRFWRARSGSAKPVALSAV